MELHSDGSSLPPNMCIVTVVFAFSQKAHKRIKRKKLSFRGFGRIKDNPQSLVETLEQASPSYPAALHEESREVAIFETILVAQGRFGRRRKVEA